MKPNKNTEYNEFDEWIAENSKPWLQRYLDDNHNFESKKSATIDITNFSNALVNELTKRLVSNIANQFFDISELKSIIKEMGINV